MDRRHPPTPTTGSVETELAYDEAFLDSGEPRAHWIGALQAYRNFPAGEFAQRVKRANRRLSEDGATFDLLAPTEHARGPLGFDLMPLVVSATEWDDVMRALDQRARLLDLVLRDLYGPQRLLEEGLLPSEIVFRNPAFVRPFHKLRPFEEQRLALYAAELARGPSGDWLVMADRTDAPAGLGFALENRLVSLQCLPRMLHNVGIQRLAAFFAALKETITKHIADHAPEEGRVVLLSTGPSADYYFEDAFLARYLGYPLVEGNDLTVRGESLYLKTLDGLAPIDAVFCRGNEAGLDPLELGGAEGHGVPGLLGAVRMVNTPGSSLLESPVFMAFLPSLSRELLGEELAIPSIATWWCGDSEGLRYTLDHLDRLVLKPAFQASGGEEIVVAELDKRQCADLVDRIKADPGAYVAQETVCRSAAPIVSENNESLDQGHVAIRAFLCADAGEGERAYLGMPGGLVRVAPTTAPMELSITAGDESKDLWVLSEGQPKPFSLLEPAGQPTPLRRSAAIFPSRVADNLFWLGLTTRRCELLARLLRATCKRLVSETEGDPTEILLLSKCLATQGQIDQRYAADPNGNAAPRFDAELVRSACDLTEPRGLAWAASEARRLASLVRGWISPDAWRRLHGATSDYLAGVSHEKPMDVGELMASLDEFLGELSAGIGQIQEGMTRGPAWRFLDIGRRIESARGVAALTRVALETRAPDQLSVLRVLLELIDCQMTYRNRYAERIQQHAVLDLVLIDETNPKSLAHEMRLAQQHVAELPQRDHQKAPVATNHQGTLVALEGLSVETLCEPSARQVVSLLKEADRELSGLVDALTTDYLIHSGPPRQIG